MDIKNLTVEEFIELKKKMDEAENDTTPYVITNDDEISVVGDPNNTEVKKHDYMIEFGYPNTESWAKTLKAEGAEIFSKTNNYIGVRRYYKDVWVPPMIYTAVQTAFAEMYQFFNVITDDGGVRDLTEEEMMTALKMLSQEMMESMAHAVATILRIPEREEMFMLPITTMASIMRMIDDFPELLNGVDFFSNASSETDMTVL